MKEEAKKKIIHLLEEAIGINPQSLSKVGWERIFSERMKSCRIGDISQYLHLLFTSPYEFQELVEKLIVPETWFYRDKGAFEFLSEYVQNDWTEADHATRPLKIMCLPAATGEEAYTISMTLLDAGFSSSFFLVDGVDISRQCLKMAERGIYGKNSFRGKDLKFRDKFFEKTAHGYAIHSTVKKSVRFYHGNIAEPSFFFETHSYQFVFCRNLLIYLSPYYQKKTLSSIAQMLEPLGIAIFGPAETQIPHNEGWERLKAPKACAFYVRRPLAQEKSRQDMPILKSKSIDAGWQDKPKNKTISKVETLAGQAASSRAGKRKKLLQIAAESADQGLFEEATSLCLNCLDLYGVNPDAFFLLGVVQHAEGNLEKAREFFQKAVYLNPGHYEALSYLALLWEKSGDGKQAELMLQRAQNAKKKLGSK